MHEPRTTYTIAEYPHGLVVFGSYSISHMAGITETAGELGYGYIAADIAGHLRRINAGPDRCTMVVVSEESGEQWRTEIDEWAADQDWPECWVLARHPGISSLTIYSVLRDESDTWDSTWLSRPDIPHDAADFGRCIRLLEEAPDEWSGRLDEVADEHPEWRPIVEEWDRLETMLEGGLHKNLADTITKLEE